MRNAVSTVFEKGSKEREEPLARTYVCHRIWERIVSAIACHTVHIAFATGPFRDIAFHIVTV